MSLLSGKILHRYSWTKMEITEDVIHRIISMAKNEGQGLIGANFKYSYTKDGNDIEFILTDEGEDEYDSDLPLAITNGEDINLLADHEQSRSDNDTREHDNEEREETEEREEHEEREQVEEREYIEENKEDKENEQESNANTPTNSSSDDANTTHEDEIDTTSEEIEAIEPEVAEDIQERTTSSGMELRPRTRINYKAFHTKGARQLAQKVKKAKKKVKRRYKIKVKDMFRRVMGIVMSHINAASKHEQVSVEEGIKRFGNKAIEAVLRSTHN